MNRLFLMILFLYGAAEAQFGTYKEYPADGTNVNALIASSLLAPDCQGVRFSSDYDGEIVLDASFVNALPFMFDRELRSDNGSRIAAKLTLTESPQTTFARHLTVVGGVIGEFDGENDLVLAGDPVCEVINYPVKFENVVFTRSAELIGGLEQPCDLEEDNIHIRISGSSAGSVIVSTGEFTYPMYNTVDLIDCEFYIHHDIADGCLISNFNNHVVYSYDARVRVSNPTIETSYAEPHFTLAPFVSTMSLFHLENATMSGLAGNAAAGLLYAVSSGDVASAPDIFYGNCNLSLLSGGIAGVAVHDAVSEVVVQDSQFTFNGNDTSSNPLGLSVEYGVFKFNICDQVEINDSQFESNSGTEAGAVYVTDNATPIGSRGLYIHGDDTEFTLNYSSGPAGAVHVDNSDNVLVSDAEFDHNWTTAPATGATAHHILFESSQLNDQSSFEEVGLVNCDFTGGSNQSNTFTEGSVEFEDSDALVRGCTFSDYYSNHALFVNLSSGNEFLVSDNSFVQPRIGVRVVGVGNEDCRLWNNLFTDAIYHAVSPGIAVNESAPGHALRIDGNTILDSGLSSIHFDGMTVIAEVCNNLIWRGTVDTEIDYEPPYDPAVSIHHNNLNGGVLAIDYASATIDASTTWLDTPVLVADSELRWDSVLLDRGTGTGNGQSEVEGFDYDFDLTNRDIGWHKPRDIETLTGSISGLESKWYKADGQVSIDVGTTGIPAGAVVRAESYADVIIHSHGAQSLDIGSATGTRTAIVGAPTKLADPADLIQLDGDHLVGSDLSMQGLLFNYAPSMSDIGDLDVVVPALDFLNVDFLELNGDLSTAVNTVEFQKYDDAMLAFSGCEGWIRNWDLSETVQDDDLPDFIGLVSSLVHVENVQFQESNASNHPFALKYVGSYEGGTEALVSESDFPKTVGGQGYEPLQIEQAFVRLEDNTFESDGAAGMYQFQSATYMNEWAGNEFTATLTQSQPLVDISSGVIDMFCGGNSFIWQSASSGNPAISYDTSNPMPAMVPEWSYNWWGYSCSSEWDDADLNDHSSFDLVPEWAWITDPLSSCTGAPPVGCDTDLSDSAWLLTQGKAAEQGDFRHVAHEYYRTIVLEHPKAKEVVETTGRLKTIGQKGDFGADYYTYVRDDLFDAADESEAVLYHLNAVQQDCNGWLVEAYSGDCLAAKNGLLAMLVGETNQKCIDVINAALTERSTYANCGGLLALNETGMLAQPIARARATRQLLLGRTTNTSESAETVLPVDFKIESCFPNPFNPVTTVRFTVPTQSHVLVRAFNLQGQLVATLQDGQLDSGVHNIQFNGSTLASGLYLIQAEAAGERDIQKVMLVK